MQHNPDHDDYAKYVERMKNRTKLLAVESMRIVRDLPRDDASRVVGRQLLRCATSVGANYRAVCRIRTTKELAAKLRIVLEEADETQYWVEILVDGKVVALKETAWLHREATELTAIFTTALEKVKRRLRE